MLDLYVPGAPNAHQTRATLDCAQARLADMRRQRDELTEAIAELQDHITTAEAQLAHAAE